MRKTLFLGLVCLGALISLYLCMRTDGRAATPSEPLPRPTGPFGQSEAPTLELPSALLTPARRTPAAEPPGPAVLVIRGVDGQPISGAPAVICRDGEVLVSSPTTEDGRLFLSEPREGVGTLVVAASPSAPQVQLVSLEPGVHEVEFELRSVVSGSILVNGAPPSEAIPLVLSSDHAFQPSRPDADCAWIEAGIPGEAATKIRATASADGSFHFHGLDPGWSGSLDLPPHYHLPGAGASRARSRLRLDGPVEGLVLDVVPLLRIVGRVVESDGGRPVPQAVIRPSIEYASDELTARYQDFVVADEEGRFGLVLESPEFQGGALRIATADERFHRDVGLEPASLRADLNLGDLSLSGQSDTSSARLLVVDTSDRPIEGAVAAAGVEGAPTLPSGQDGRIEVRNVIPGLSTINVCAVGFQTGELAVPAELTEEIVVTLRRGTLLRIRLSKPDGAAARVLVRLSASEHPFRHGAGFRSVLAYSRAGNSIYMPLPEHPEEVAIRTLTDREGCVTLTDLKPGLPLHLSVEGHFGSTGLLDLAIAALAPEEHRELELTIESRVGTVPGRIIDDGDGRPVAGARVWIHFRTPGFDDYLQSLSIRSDASGRFEFRDVYAESVQLSIDKDGYVPLRANPQVSFDGERVDYRLEPGEHDVLVLLEDQSGESLGGEVYATLESGARVTAEEVSPGEYALRDLPDTLVVIEARVSQALYTQRHDPLVPTARIVVPVHGRVEALVQVPPDSLSRAEPAYLWLLPFDDEALSVRWARLSLSATQWPIHVGFDAVIPGPYDAVAGRWNERTGKSPAFQALSERVRIEVAPRTTVNLEIRP